MEKRKTKNNLLIIIMLGVILVAGVVLACLLIFADRGPINENELVIRDNETVRVEQEEEDAKNGGKTSDPKDQPGGSDRADIEEPADGEKIKAYVQLNNIQDRNGMLTARGSVTNVTSASGECAFRFVTPDGEAIEVKAEPLSNPTYITCSAASTQINGRKGTWKVSLWYGSDKAEGWSPEVLYEVK